MPNTLQTSFLALLFILTIACNKTEKSKNKYSVIPKIEQLQEKEGFFKLDKTLKIYLKPDFEEIRTIANLTGTYFKEFGVKQVSVNMQQKGNESKGIYFQINSNIKGRESYQLDVNQDKITIQASAPNGLFYGVQSLRQLVKNNKIPNCVIKDKPQFTYRGMHLDVSRHFFSVEEIKKYLDQLAFHKMNKFHWHLTDARLADRNQAVPQINVSCFQTKRNTNWTLQQSTTTI